MVLYIEKMVKLLYILMVVRNGGWIENYTGGSGPAVELNNDLIALD